MILLRLVRREAFFFLLWRNTLSSHRNVLHRECVNLQKGSLAKKKNVFKLHL